MCGRYAFFMPLSDVQLMFDIDDTGPEVDSLAPSWNVAPTHDIAVIVDRRITAEQYAVSREMHVARWGLLPSWARSLTSGPPLFNARIETVAEKKSFAQAFRKRRCLIPANGYFEWKNDDGVKTPYYITSDTPLVFAGLYEWWRSPDGAWVLSATIVTQAARPPLDAIHDRTPVVLEPHEFSEWLDPTLTDPRRILSLIDRPNRLLTAHAVGNSVGNVRHNSPENIAYLPPA